MTGQHQRADRTIDHALPEAAALRGLGNAGVNGFAETADEFREIADARRDDSLDLLAQAARHHRRSAAGADRDHDIAAVDDRRKNESGMRDVVHHIDGQPERFRTQRHRNADIACARAEHRDHAREIGGQRIALGEIDARELRRFQTVRVMRARGRIPADARAGCQQNAQLRQRKLAGAGQNDRTGLQIEEDRQIAHSKLTFPLWG